MGPLERLPAPKLFRCFWMTHSFSLISRSTDYSSVALSRWCWQPSIHSPICPWASVNWDWFQVYIFLKLNHLLSPIQVLQKHQIFLHSRWFSTSQSDPTNWPLHFSLMVILLTLMAHYRCPWRTGSPNAAQSWHSKRSDVKESLNSMHLIFFYIQHNRINSWKNKLTSYLFVDCGR